MQIKCCDFVLKKSFKNRLQPHLVPKRLAACSLATLALFYSACGSVPLKDSEITVTGGRQVGVTSQLPTRVSTVALTDRDLATRGRSYCTGTLVHPVVVLTAAHCVTDTAGRFMPLAHIAFGHRVSSDPFLLNKMVGVAVHHRWTGDFPSGSEAAHDLALVRMSATFKGAKPIAIRGQEDWLPKKILIAGYGVSKGRSEDDSGLLRATYMKVININPHQRIMTSVGYPRKGYALLPTGFGDYQRKRVRSGACAGDSGGPAYSKESGDQENSHAPIKGAWTLAGVTSFGWEYELEGEEKGRDYCIGQNGYTYLSPYKNMLERAILDLAKASVSESSHQFRITDDGQLQPVSKDFSAH